MPWSIQLFCHFVFTAFYDIDLFLIDSHVKLDNSYQSQTSNDKLLIPLGFAIINRSRQISFTIRRIKISRYVT